MKGYFTSGSVENEQENAIGRLRIEITNIPEFQKLIKQAQKEADQLNKTINQLQNFELNIDFVSNPTSLEL